MTDTNQNVKIYRGDSATLPITVTMADGSPFDATLDIECKWRMARTWYATEDETLIKKELGFGIDLTPTGVTVTLAPEDTENLMPAIYYHELKVWEGTDRSTTLTGVVILKPSLNIPKDAIGSLGLQGHAPAVSVA